ncbi:MAG: hypothetical protein DDT31_01057 [Syntrophomonadaceae bacterium]|nr:hypothetical protein [Bacillota bacterium]
MESQPKNHKIEIKEKTYCFGGKNKIKGLVLNVFSIKRGFSTTK